MAKKKRNTPRRACFLDRCHHRTRSIPLGTPTCNLPASFPSKRLLRHDVHIGILVGRTRAVSSLGLVTFADGCPMRPIPPGHCPHRGPISSNRTPDSMGFDAHRTPPPMGILPEADGVESRQLGQPRMTMTATGAAVAARRVIEIGVAEAAVAPPVARPIDHPCCRHLPRRRRSQRAGQDKETVDAG